MEEGGLMSRTLRKRGSVGALICLALLILVLWVVIQVTGDGAQMKKIFASEVQQELDKTMLSAEVFEEEDFLLLPKPIQRYFRHNGFLGQTKMSTARIIFDEADFKNGNMDLALYSEQFNFVEEPARIVYMHSTLLGVIPFEGRDKFQDGAGFMTGKLAKLITLFDVSGPEMQQSALVTLLAETLVVPTYALQDYIIWEEINENQAQATISYNGASATGIFTIDDDCETVTFRTTDRYMDQGQGSFELVPWRAEISGSREQDGIRVPDRFKGIWEMPEGDLVYFDGEISSIEYNVEHL